MAGPRLHCVGVSRRISRDIHVTNILAVTPIRWVVLAVKLVEEWNQASNTHPN